MTAIFEDTACLLTPSTTTPAPKGLEYTGNPAFNVPWSFCGFPAITLPSGLTRNGLPLGIQLAAKHFNEKYLLKVARWCENALGFRKTPDFP
jgi:Asp-tRNA(Asn)/Glu-tRNA(Gln) amidotransferase A subunit family amidase